jgi:hypothetical protein
MTTTVLSEGSDRSATIVSDGSVSPFNWSAVIGGAAVAVATAFFLTMLGVGFGLTLMPRQPGTGFFTLGAIYFLAAQAFGFVAGGHVTGRLIGPALESRKQEEWRAGLAGLVMWAVTVAAGLVLLALVAAGGGPQLHGDSARSESSIATYWTDILFQPVGPHQPIRAEELAQDKLEAARVLAADLHPGNAVHVANRADLMRLTAMNSGASAEATAERVDSVEMRMREELDMARKAAGYSALWMALALLFGAVLAIASAVSAGWEEDKLSFSMKRRY